MRAAEGEPHWHVMSSAAQQLCLCAISPVHVCSCDDCAVRAAVPCREGLKRLPPPLQANPLLGLCSVFDGLRPGRMVGEGRFGIVYQCTWHNAKVAVKVHRQMALGLQSRRCADLAQAQGCGGDLPAERIAESLTAPQVC